MIRKLGACLEKEMVIGTMPGTKSRGRHVLYNLAGQLQDVDRAITDGSSE